MEIQLHIVINHRRMVDVHDRQRAEGRAQGLALGDYLFPCFS
jgi:hypothetical protein